MTLVMKMSGRTVKRSFLKMKGSRNMDRGIGILPHIKIVLVLFDPFQPFLQVSVFVFRRDRKEGVAPNLTKHQKLLIRILG